MENFWFFLLRNGRKFIYTWQLWYWFWWFYLTRGLSGSDSFALCITWNVAGSWWRKIGCLYKVLVCLFPHLFWVSPHVHLNVQSTASTKSGWDGIGHKKKHTWRRSKHTLYTNPLYFKEKHIKGSWNLLSHSWSPEYYMNHKIHIYDITSGSVRFPFYHSHGRVCPALLQEKLLTSVK